MYIAYEWRACLIGEKGIFMFKTGICFYWNFFLSHILILLVIAGTMILLRKIIFFWFFPFGQVCKVQLLISVCVPNITGWTKLCTCIYLICILYILVWFGYLPMTNARCIRYVLSWIITHSAVCPFQIFFK